MNHLMCTLTLLALGTFPGLSETKAQPKQTNLTATQIADGCVQLFDGETTFGWKIDGEAKVEKDSLVLGGDKETTATFKTQFAYGTLRFEAFTDEAKDAKVTFNTYKKGSFINVAPPGEQGWHYYHAQAIPGDISVWAAGSKGIFASGKADEPTMIAFHVPTGQKLRVRNINFFPGRFSPIFNGKDLTGWKEVKTSRTKSKFIVTDKGELNIKNGPGDLQSDGQWDDFVLQVDVLSNGPHLNSGVFFRCILGQFWSGYEAQIRNQWEGEDRTKPVDYGTGGIYNRQPARKVVSSDHEWFTMIVVAHGNHMAVWVDGYQTADFTDNRPPDKSARKGSKMDKGSISLQGHDPTTDLSFRNIRIASFPKDAR